MKKDKKKLAAAIAGVYAYLSTYEQAAAAAQAAEPVQEQVQPQTQILPGPQPNIWGISGRSAQMQANTMMQLRAFK